MQCTPIYENLLILEFHRAQNSPSCDFWFKLVFRLNAFNIQHTLSNFAAMPFALESRALNKTVMTSQPDYKQNWPVP